MDLALLRVFETVIAEGSFSRAGQKLYRSQPAISLAMQRLEAEFGASLIDRSCRPLQMTDAGREVAVHARRLLAQEHKMRVAIQELSDLRAGKLTIGANESTALYLLRHVVGFREQHPGIHVELRRSLSSRIPDAVLEGSLEMGAISYDPGDPRLQSIHLYQDRLTFVVSPAHRFAGRKSLTIGDLGEETFIAHNVVSPYRARVIEAFRRHQVQLQMAIEMPTIETIRRLVQRNLGVAFLPRMCVEQQIRNGALIEIEVRELSVERTIRLVYAARRSLAQASLAFLELLGERPASRP